MNVLSSSSTARKKKPYIMKEFILHVLLLLLSVCYAVATEALLESASACKCTAKYNVRMSKGGIVQAYCGEWSYSKFDWCYLDNGLQAKSCPGAVKSQTRDIYWTKHLAICDPSEYIRNLMKSSLAKLNEPGLPDLATKWDNVQQSCIESQDCKAAFSDYATRMEQIALGFAASNEIFQGISQVLEKSEFDSVSKVLGKIAPFLGAFGPVVEIIGLFGDSPEVQRLNQVIGMLNDGFNRMEHRFDVIEKKFTDLENTIRKEHFWTRLQKPLRDFSNVQERINGYFASTDKEIRKERAGDLQRTEYDKVYDALIAIRDTFLGLHEEEPLCEAVSRFSKTDRKMVLQMGMDFLNRMIKGSLNLVLISRNMGRKDANKTEQDMNKLLEEISKMISDCDKDIKENKWLHQWKEDVEELVPEKIEKGKENTLADAIYRSLTTKYDWRDFLVVVYPDMYGFDKHTRRTCRNHYPSLDLKHIHKKYNILVSSKPSTASTNKFSTGHIQAYHTERYPYQDPDLRGRIVWKTRLISWNAKRIYDNLPSKAKNDCFYPLVGVVLNKGTFAVRAPAKRLFKRVVDSKKKKCSGFFWKQKCHAVKYNVYVLG